MKFFAAIIPALALAGTIQVAQAQSPVMKEEGHMPKKGKPMESKGMMRDCVLMKDGKMMTMKDGKTMPMTETMTMNNGTKVMANGHVMMAGGKSMMLQNGQCVLMDGHVVKDKMKSSM